MIWINAVAGDGDGLQPGGILVSLVELLAHRVDETEIVGNVLRSMHMDRHIHHDHMADPAGRPVSRPGNLAASHVQRNVVGCVGAETA
jgi:hypothetical protein